MCLAQTPALTQSSVNHDDGDNGGRWYPRGMSKLGHHADLGSHPHPSTYQLQDFRQKTKLVNRTNSTTSPQPGMGEGHEGKQTAWKQVLPEWELRRVDGVTPRLQSSPSP